jgi:hypothetical protein
MRIHRIIGTTVCLLVWALAPCAPVLAQEAPDDEESALAMQSQNPVANLISLPLQSNTFFNIGENDRTAWVMNIQPVIPVHAGPVNIITRTIFPLRYGPDVFEPSGGTFGTGDTTFTAFVTPAKPGKLIFGAGPVALFPTASDKALGTEKWGLGPSAVVLTMRGPWVMGVLVSQLWSVGGADERNDISGFLTQYFINYNLPHGWFITSAPIITANWKRPDGNKWVVPFGGGFGKVFRVGSQAMNFNTQIFYNAVKPDDFPSSNIEWRFQLNFLFPKR